MGASVPVAKLAIFLRYIVFENAEIPLGDLRDGHPFVTETATSN